MTMPSLIPDWYATDWTPAKGRWEWSQMTWDAVEAVIVSGLLPPARQGAAQAAFRTLAKASANLDPLELLPRFLATSAAAFDPRYGSQEPDGKPSDPTPATGLLPRWSYTDLEAALSVLWSGTALAIATARHHDLLERRGEPMTPEQAVRLLVLMTAGLPSRPALRLVASAKTRAAD